MSAKVIEDIIALKKRMDLMEEDATDERQREWYRYLLNNGLLEFEYKDNKLIGFIEFIRIGAVPNSLDDLEVDYDNIRNNSVLFVCNAIAIDKGTLMRMRRRVLDRNKNLEALCWHRKRTGKIYKSSRRIYVNS